MFRHHSWLAALLAAGCAREPEPPASALIALTPTEYNNTIRDLLGFPANAWPQPPAIAERLSPGAEPAVIFGVSSGEVSPWPWVFPDEAGVDGFDGMADGQEPSAYRIEELQKASVHYAAYALVSDLFFTCDSWERLSTADQGRCGQQSIVRFAQRAWRRPLDEAERERLIALWAEQWQAGSPDEAVVITVSAILQAPQFLFRVERGDLEADDEGGRPLTGFEVASRLSYFLWDTMPDGALFEAAGSGALDTAAGIREQVGRMLADPRAEPAVARFHEQLLGTEDVLLISPARSAYGPLFGVDPETPLDTTGDAVWPSLMGAVRHSMAAEMHLFVADHLLNGAGTLTALLTAEEGYISAETAPLYGAVTVDEGAGVVAWDYSTVSASIAQQGTLQMYRVQYPPGQRAGLLSLPAVLSVGAYTVQPAPIRRGKTILERLTCTQLGAPPPGAEGAAPADAEEVESTNRLRTEAATEAAACSGCHNILNPPGFAFEHYDAMGHWRAEDNGFPVDASGSFSIRGEDFSFTDGIGLAAQLAASDVVRECYALHWARVATGEHLDRDDPRLASILSGFQDNDHIPTLLEDIVLSDLFRTLQVGGGQP